MTYLIINRIPVKRNSIYLPRAGLLLALLIGLAVLHTGCMKRDLEHRALEGHLSVTLDWGEYPVPAGAKFYFYPEQGGETLVFETPATGFDGMLPSGKYRLIVTNTDAVGVDYQAMDRYETAEVYALEQVAASGSASMNGPQSRSGGTCIAEPTQVYGAAKCSEVDLLHILPQGVHEHIAIPIVQTKLVKLIFEISGLEQIDRMLGIFNGVTPSVQFATGRGAEASRSVAFTAAAQGKGYAALFNVFNIAGDFTAAPVPGTNTIDLNVDTGTGPKNIQIDIANTIHEIIKNNEGVIPLEIPINISLEVVDGELIATVRPWEEGGGSDSDIN